MNDDDVDFKPSQSTRTNLTSLFDTNRPGPAENQTLTYTPPKPPKTKDSSSTPVRGSSSRNLGTEKLEIIISKNVQLYKLENGKYVGQGAAGIAIIGHFELHIYQIILYKNNKEYLSKTYVQPNFIFTVLENNYASFYDNARQNWSILFPSSSDVQIFAKQVAIARYNSQSKKEKIIVQDLIPLGSATVNKHDIVKFECSCSILNSDEITLLKGKSNWSVEITDLYAFPWQEGLKDCSYKCKRVVITPYKLSAPWKDEIHESSSILVEFEVESVNPPEHLVQNETLSVKTKILDERITDSSAHEDNYNVKPVSLTDSLFLSKSHKADLISRVARMGQALPSKVALASSSTESPIENSSSLRQGSSETNMAHQQMHQTLQSNFCPSFPQQTEVHQAHPMSTNSSHRCEHDITWQQQPMTGGMNFVYQELHPVMSGPPGPSQHGNAKGYEAIGTDAELRITINKVSEKVDFLLNKLQNLDMTGWDKVKAHQSAIMLDPVNVINSIQDVMAENENLKMEIEQQKTKIKEQGSKLHSLMELTQRCVERCAYPDRKPAATSAAGQILESEERLGMSGKLMTETQTKINQVTCEIEKYRQEIFDNQQEIKQRNAEIQDLVGKLREKERVIHNMESKLFESNAAKEAVIAANEMLKKEIQHFKRQGDREKSTELQPALSQDSAEEIKKVMNAVNRKLQSYLKSDQSYSGRDIKVAVATTLKDVTVEYLKYRNKQKIVSRMEDSQRVGSGTSDEKMEISDVQNSPEHTTSNLRTEEADDSRKEKSRVASVWVKPVSQRLSFADEQPSHGTENFTEKPIEKCLKLKSDTVGVESGSSLQQNDVVRTTTSHLINIHTNFDDSKTSHNMKNMEVVDSESQRSDLPSRISGGIKSGTSQFSSQPSRVRQADEHQDVESDRRSGLTTAESNTTTTKTLPADSNMLTVPSSADKSLTPSSLLPGGNESLKGDMSTMMEKPWGDHKTKSVEVEKPVTTLSHITKSTTLSPSSSSLIDNYYKHQTSSNFDTESSSEAKESAAEVTTTPDGQLSDTDEILWKKLNSKGETETTSGVESFAYVGGHTSDDISFRPTNLNTKIQSETVVEKMSLDNPDPGKNSEQNISRKTTTSKAPTDISIQVHAEFGNGSFPTEGFDENCWVKSQIQHEEKSYPVTGERDLSKENDIEKGEGEKSSNDDNVLCPVSHETLKFSGSNAAEESSLYNHYYQGWESSKPPPLPLEDDENASETDEEWP